MYLIFMVRPLASAGSLHLSAQLSPTERKHRIDSSHETKCDLEIGEQRNQDLLGHTEHGSDLVLDESLNGSELES